MNVLDKIKVLFKKKSTNTNTYMNLPVDFNCNYQYTFMRILSHHYLFLGIKNINTQFDL